MTLHKAFLTFSWTFLTATLCAGAVQAQEYYNGPVGQSDAESDVWQERSVQPQKDLRPSGNDDRRAYQAYRGDREGRSSNGQGGYQGYNGRGDSRYGQYEERRYQGQYDERRAQYEERRLRGNGQHAAGRSPYDGQSYRLAERYPSNGYRVRQASAEAPTSARSNAGRALNREEGSPEEIPAPDATNFEPLASDGPYAGGEGGSCGTCDSGDCGFSDGGDCFGGGSCFPCLLGNWENRTFQAFGGAVGFKGPRDNGKNGNFGFDEGFNFGAPLGDPWGCGFQAGFAAIQTNFSGDQSNSDSVMRTADRHQYFVTAGFFRRADVGEIQWGVVFDYMHDDYYQSSDLQQIRTETGWLFSECNEIGYSGAYSISTDRMTNYFGRNIDGKLDPTDQFVLYFRHYFQNGGDGRIFGGATGEGDGLIGADFWVPLGGNFALQNSFNCLIPKEGRGAAGGQEKESWGLMLNLVWCPGREAACVGRSTYRPVLNVADNGQFMVKQTAQAAP